MSDEVTKAELERLRQENAELKRKTENRRDVYLKVAEKGGLSVYGLGRFPITLYQEQWVKLLAMSAEIQQFIRDNQNGLKVKE